MPQPITPIYTHSWGDAVRHVANGSCIHRITCGDWLARAGNADQAQHTLDVLLTKARFWQRWATTPLNERQVELLNKLLDGLEGKLTSNKWVAIAKCSPDTALRDINGLLTRGVLRKSDADGRSTSYELNDLAE